MSCCAKTKQHHIHKTAYYLCRFSSDTLIFFSVQSQHKTQPSTLLIHSRFNNVKDHIDPWPVLGTTEVIWTKILEEEEETHWFLFSGSSAVARYLVANVIFFEMFLHVLRFTLDHKWVRIISNLQQIYILMTMTACVANGFASHVPLFRALYVLLYCLFIGLLGRLLSPLSRVPKESSTCLISGEEKLFWISGFCETRPMPQRGGSFATHRRWVCDEVCCTTCASLNTELQTNIILMLPHFQATKTLSQMVQHRYWLFILITHNEFLTISIAVSNSLLISHNQSLLKIKKRNHIPLFILFD